MKMIIGQVERLRFLKLNVLSSRFNDNDYQFEMRKNTLKLLTKPTEHFERTKPYEHPTKPIQDMKPI